MGSSNEHTRYSETSNPKELQLLSEVENVPDITQRELAQKLGIALGLTNTLVRNLTQKGYLRVVQASWKRRLYTLTPDGFSHKLRLITSYITRFINDYKNIRQTLRDELHPLALHAESRVAIYGTGEFAELVYIGLREIGIEEINVFDASGTVKSKFLGIPVQDVSRISSERYDWVLVANLVDQESTRSQLRGLGIEKETLVIFFENGRINGDG
jgi:DNA-binding MarR family transcriptional regulator